MTGSACDSYSYTVSQMKSDRTFLIKLLVRIKSFAVFQWQKENSSWNTIKTR